MEQVSQVYKGGFFKNRHRLSWRAEYLCGAVIQTFSLKRFDTIVDAGCAIGDYVKWFNDHGYISWGIEGSAAAKEFMVTDQHSIWDLRTPLNMGPDQGSRYTLAMSLEVAEHIDLEFSGVYLDNLCVLGNSILMTAAPPGQKGHGHVNCQEKGWWTCEMVNRNYERMYEMEDLFQKNLGQWSHRKELNVYAKNCMIFRRRNNG